MGKKVFFLKKITHGIWTRDHQHFNPSPYQLQQPAPKLPAAENPHYKWLPSRRGPSSSKVGLQMIFGTSSMISSSEPKWHRAFSPELVRIRFSMSGVRRRGLRREGEERHSRRKSQSMAIISTRRVPRTKATAPSQMRVSKSSRPISRWRASSVREGEKKGVNNVCRPATIR